MCNAHRRAFMAKSVVALAGCATALTFGTAQAQAPAPAPAGSDKPKWICPPCGCPSDGTEFDAAGSCPSCSMTLIPKPAPKPAGGAAGRPAPTPPAP